MQKKEAEIITRIYIIPNTCATRLVENKPRIEDEFINKFFVSQELEYEISFFVVRFVAVRPPINIDLINILTEDYLAGYTQDGRMSVVRRFFCLFVIFDLFFISLLWLICIMV